ncbi:MAG: hypothetical protein J3K34DRAFT_399511 [Monoraphidium minutum]|nr:MAG: hypothetical protein J3K34DRAFT_399511 [Monoraphidium minutum]
MPQVPFLGVWASIPCRFLRLRPRSSRHRSGRTPLPTRTTHAAPSPPGGVIAGPHALVMAAFLPPQLCAGLHFCCLKGNASKAGGNASKAATNPRPQCRRPRRASSATQPACVRCALDSPLLAHPSLLDYTPLDYVAPHAPRPPALTPPSPHRFP